MHNKVPLAPNNHRRLFCISKGFVNIHVKTVEPVYFQAIDNIHNKKQAFHTVVSTLK